MNEETNIPHPFPLAALGNCIIHCMTDLYDDVDDEAVYNVNI